MSWLFTLPVAFCSFIVQLEYSFFFFFFFSVTNQSILPLSSTFSHAWSMLSVHLFVLVVMLSCIYCRCFDANLIGIPVEVETPDHHYYHVCIAKYFCHDKMLMDSAISPDFALVGLIFICQLYFAASFFHNQENRSSWGINLGK